MKRLFTLIVLAFVAKVSFGQESVIKHEFIVKHIDSMNVEAIDIPGLFARNDVNYVKIGIADWPLLFPYTPDVKYAMAYTDDAILIHYVVNEDDVRAFVDKDHGSVWKDSCVETFMIPGGDDQYYNLECNCLGYIHMAVGNAGNRRENASKDVLDGIKRWASLGREAFGRKTRNTTWELALVVPYTTFFNHDVKMVSGSTMKANAFKCGGTEGYEHYLSLFPIINPKPAFHKPEFFGTFRFE